MIKKILLTLTFVFITIGEFVFAQNITGNQTDKLNSAYRIKVGFYNTQNLFDTINQPMVRDGEYTPEGKKNWNTAKYNEKLGRLANVIDQIDCDVVGLCEIENYGVVRDLTKLTENTNFAVEHYETTDFRGIDQALIYDTTKFNVISSELVPTATHRPKRGLLRVEMQCKVTDKQMVFYVAHLPSKLGGDKAAKSRDTIINQFGALNRMEMKRDANRGRVVMIIGDMNNDVIEIDGMNNLAAPLEKMGVGTYLYRRVWSMLDQVLVSDWACVSKLSVKTPNNIKINGRSVRGSDHLPVYFHLEL